MREILFIGKRTDNGEWVEGFYFEELGSFIKEKPYKWNDIQRIGNIFDNPELLKGGAE